MGYGGSFRYTYNLYMLGGINLNENVKSTNIQKHLNVSVL